MNTSTLIRVPILTVWEPWATMIALDFKTVENRTWRPTAGQVVMNDALLIHSANRRPDPDALDYIRERLDGRRVADVYARMAPGRVRCCVTYRGADVACCTPYDAPGQWHWRLVDPVEPPELFPLMGQQGVFFATAETHPEIFTFATEYISTRAARKGRTA